MPPALMEFAVSLEVASREDAKAVCIRLFQLLRSMLLSLPETLRLVQHVASMLEWARSSGALDRRIDPLVSRPVYATPTDSGSPAALTERSKALNEFLDVEELLRWDSNQKWDDAERTEHNADVISSSSSLSSSSSSFSSSSQSSALSIADTNDDDSDHRRFQRMVNDSRYQPYLEALHEKPRCYHHAQNDRSGYQGGRRAVFLQGRDGPPRSTALRSGGARSGSGEEMRRNGA